MTKLKIKALGVELGAEGAAAVAGAVAIIALIFAIVVWHSPEVLPKLFG